MSAHLDVDVLESRSEVTPAEGLEPTPHPLNVLFGHARQVSSLTDPERLNPEIWLCRGC